MRLAQLNLWKEQPNGERARCRKHIHSDFSEDGRY
jgi:hypothetical protein